MAHGAPDWTRKVEVVFTSAQPAIERAAGGAGRYSGGAVAYQTVVTWTVAAGYIGELKEILVLSDTYDKTHVKVTIGAVVWCTDWIVISAMPIIFEDLRLAAATVVKVETKSTDATAIVVDAIITAKEVVV